MLALPSANSVVTHYRDRSPRPRRRPGAPPHAQATESVSGRPYPAACLNVVSTARCGRPRVRCESGLDGLPVG